MSKEEQYRRILSNHLPAAAVDWVYAYVDRHRVHFRITRERQSKLGDYRWPQPTHPGHEISVNGDLNPFFFLWVFLHEAAHLETHLKYPGGVPPHGHEWQEEYRQLLRQHAAAFPADLQPLLARYTRRVPLPHPVQREIEAALRRHDPGYDPATAAPHLDSLQPGAHFALKRRPELLFQALERRRTRWLCRELRSGRQYLVNGSAEVIVAEG